MAKGFQHIGAESLLIRQGTARIIEASVDLAVEVFDEVAVDQRTDLTLIPLTKSPKSHDLLSPSRDIPH